MWQKLQYVVVRQTLHDQYQDMLAHNIEAALSITKKNDNEIKPSTANLQRQKDFITNIISTIGHQFSPSK